MIRNSYHKCSTALGTTAVRTHRRKASSKTSSHTHSSECSHPPPIDRTNDKPQLPVVPKPKFTPQYIRICMESVRKVDYPSYFCSLFLPGPSRFAAFGLRAFNIETASIKNRTQNVQTGILKLGWWRQAIESCYQNEPPPQHPVALALNDAIHSFKLSRTWFNKIIDSREKDLRVTQPRTLADIETYAENTTSSLFYLTLESVGVRDFSADHAASHLGKATGLMTLIRAIPFQAQQRQLYIPVELCAKHNVKPEDVFSGKTTPQLQEAVYEIANQAKSHLDLSRELMSSVRYPANLALLQAEWTDQYLLMLQKRDFNPFDDALRQNTMKQRLFTLKNYYLNKF